MKERTTVAGFMMIMKGGESTDGWDTYIEKLVSSGLFRGGSALGNGVCVTNPSLDIVKDCAVTGFMRFEADNIDKVKALLADNPVFVAGGEVELLEIVES